MANEKPQKVEQPLTMDTHTIPPAAEPTLVDLEVPAPDAESASKVDEPAKATDVEELGKNHRE